MVVGHWVEGNTARRVVLQHFKIPEKRRVDGVDAMCRVLLQKASSWDPQESEGVVLATLSCELRKSEAAVLRLSGQVVQPISERRYAIRTMG